MVVEIYAGRIQSPIHPSQSFCRSFVIARWFLIFWQHSNYSNIAVYHMPQSVTTFIQSEITLITDETDGGFLPSLWNVSIITLFSTCQNGPRLCFVHRVTCPPDKLNSLWFEVRENSALNKLSWWSSYMSIELMFNDLKIHILFTVCIFWT